MMRMTIIRSDGFVSIDDVGYSGLDLSSIDISIHAVQWSGESGFVEYAVAQDGTKPQNELITSMEMFQSAIDVWAAANEKANKPTIPEPSTAGQIMDGIVQEAQYRLDSFAKTRNYDGILSLATYATSTNPKFQAEGQYGVEARDATWAKLYEILAEVEAGTRPMPEGYTDVEPELPVLEWPIA